MCFTKPYTTIDEARVVTDSWIFCNGEACIIRKSRVVPDHECMKLIGRVQIAILFHFQGLLFTDLWLWLDGNNGCFLWSFLVFF